ncbi:MAG: T9SS type B sorting domain-containing protein, partial [Bacteroidetes bacterium]|nr:T9SS type B sorting domain-containing protein [Bacteroidota bacterium]
IPVSVTGFEGIVSMQHSMSFDPALLQFQNIQIAGTLEDLSTANFGTNNAGTGSLTLSWLQQSLTGVDLADGTVIYNVCFTAMGQDASTTFQFTSTPTAAEVINNMDQEVPFASQSSTVTIGAGSAGGEDFSVNAANVTVDPGQQVCVPVSVTGFDGIVSMQYSMSFDPTILQYQNVQVAGTLEDLSASNFGTNNAGAGSLTLSWLQQSLTGVDLADGTVIYNVCFMALGQDAATTFQFTSTPTAAEVIDNMDQEVPFASQNSTITIGAGTGGSEFSIMATNQTVQYGQQVCVPVSVEGFDEIISLQYSMSFDPAKLEYQSIQLTGTLEDLNQANFGTNNASQGSLTLSWLQQSLTGVTLADNTIIFEVCFLANGEGNTSTPFAFTNAPTVQEVINSNDEEVPFDSQNASITIEGAGTGGNDFNIIANNVTVDAGQQICVPVSVQGFTEIVSMQYSMSFNATLLQFESIQASGTLEDLSVSNFGTNNAGQGQLTLSWLQQALSGVSLNDNTVIYEVCFTALGSGNVTTFFQFTNSPTTVEVINAADDEVPFNSQPGVINIQPGAGGDNFKVLAGNDSVQIGEEFCIPVSVGGFTGITSMQFTMTFNPMMLELQNVGNFNLTGLTSAQIDTPGENGNPPGTITIDWTDISGTGVSLPNGTTIFEVCFIAVGSAGVNTMLNIEQDGWEVQNAQQELLPYMASNGTVTINGTVDPNDFSVTAGNVTTPSGGQFCVPISVQGFFDIASFQFTMNYDPTALQFQSVGNFNLQNFSEEQVGTPGEGPVLLPGVITVNWLDESTQGIDLVNGTVLFEACFTALAPNGASTIIQFSDYPVETEVGDSQQNIIPFVGIEGIITIINATSATGLVTSVSCNGGTNGVINITPTGGILPYSFAWDNDMFTEDISGLQAGSYTVTLSDSESNTFTATYEITEPPALVINNILVNDITEAGNDGTVSINVTGGTGAGSYSYSWEGPQNYTADTQNILQLSQPGTYSITVTDANNCVVVESIEVRFPMLVEATVSEFVCFGESNGFIQLNISGGLQPITFDWSSDALDGIQSPSNLSNGTYSVTVTDGTANSFTQSFTISLNPQIFVAANLTPENGPESTNDGAIDLIANGGSGGFTYFWNPNGFTSEDLSGLNHGTYNVTVTDAKGCTKDETFDVPYIPIPIDVNSQVEPVSCSGGTDGQLVVTVTGGDPIYTFVFDDGVTLEGVSGVAVRNGLSPGTIGFTVTDKNGQQWPGQRIIPEPDPIQVTSLQIVPDIYDAECNGNITITVSGGTGGYNYNWSNGKNTEDLGSLCADDYYLTITDEKGCEETFGEYTVKLFGLEPPDVTNTDCPNTINGAIDITVIGGTNVQYTWRNAFEEVISTSEDIDNLGEGIYTVIVLDESGAQISYDLTVSTESGLTVETEVLTDYSGFGVSCNGQEDAMLEARGLNSDGNYTFEWSNEATEAILENVGEGTFSVTVTDGFGCEMSSFVNVSQPPLMVVELMIDEVSCYGKRDGTASAIVSGGVEPYIYWWNDPESQNTSTAFALNGGDYQLTVMDDNGCETIQTINVQEPDILNVAVETTPDEGGLVGTALAVVSGGTEPFSFLWNDQDNRTYQLLDKLKFGEYTVQVVDDNGCTALASGLVEDAANCLEMRNVITPDGDGANEEFVIKCLSSFPDNTLEIFNRWGQMVYETDNYDNTWSGTSQREKDLPEGGYFFVFRYRDEQSGDLQQLKGSITILRE